MNKKVWIYVSIIVLVFSLFPSILVVRAEEGGGTGDIPDRTYSFENAPFPGTYEKLTESSWQNFIERAEDLGHKEIRKLVWIRVVYDDGTKREFDMWGIQCYYSTDDNDLEEIFELDTKNRRYKWYLYNKDREKTNKLSSAAGHKYGIDDFIYFISAGYVETRVPVGVEYITERYYSAELSDDIYQEKPIKYNIDDENNYGMWFKKPSYGELINIPKRLFSYKDWIEIEIQIPREYMPIEGEKETLFKVFGQIEKTIMPNFVIKMYKNNVGNIYGSYILGSGGTWILPKDITCDKVFKNGSEIIGAKFTAKVPIEHIVPEDGGSSLIVADLYLFESNNSEQRYSVRIPEARTWTRYQTYVGVVDANGDGIDDRTGLPVDDDKEPDYNIGDEKPDINNYDNTILGRLSYYWDTLVYYVKIPFKYIGEAINSILKWIDETLGSWIDSFILIFEKLFGFLPREIVVLLELGFTTVMIITIIKAIRGE